MEVLVHSSNGWICSLLLAWDHNLFLGIGRAEKRYGQMVSCLALQQACVRFALRRQDSHCYGLPITGGNTDRSPSSHPGQLTSLEPQPFCQRARQTLLFYPRIHRRCRSPCCWRTSSRRPTSWRRGRSASASFAQNASSRSKILWSRSCSSSLRNSATIKTSPIASSVCMR